MIAKHEIHGAKEFDAADRADFGRPDAPPAGIDYVFVNGRLALAHGNLLDSRAGKAVRCTEPVYDYQI